MKDFLAARSAAATLAGVIGSLEISSNAAPLWIVDDSEDWKAVDFALSHEVPLLIPETSTTVKQIWVSGNCGMYYRDASIAWLSLEFLVADHGIRKRMGAPTLNGNSAKGAAQ